MPEMIWIDDVPMPNMAEEDYQESEYKDYEDSDWYNDPNSVMSRHHYWIMIEIAAAYIVGMMQVAPNLIQTDYFNEDKQIISVTEVIQEVSEWQKHHSHLKNWMQF